ncbi:MAG TPA: glycosyltransferase, partial [Clostridia bacterium]|nr:glycosyltransferase [Clostridia bacterium]
RALKILQDEGEQWTVLFTITGHENACARQLAGEAKGLGGRVILAGQLPREQIAEFCTQSILVFPSWLETFGMPLMEAREAGGWVVAADTPSTRETLDGYSRAILSERASPVDLARCMRLAWNARHDSAGQIQAEDVQPAGSSAGGGWEGVASIVGSTIRAAWLRREALRGGSL